MALRCVSWPLGVAVRVIRSGIASWRHSIRDTFLAVFGGILDVAGDPQHAVLVSVGWVLFLSAPLLWLHGICAAWFERALVWPERAKESAGQTSPTAGRPCRAALFS